MFTINTNNIKINQQKCSPPQHSFTNLQSFKSLTDYQYLDTHNLLNSANIVYSNFYLALATQYKSSVATTQNEQ